MSSLRPSFDDNRIVPDLRVLDGVASWCGGLHGSMPLDQALKALAVGLGASAAAITRHHHRTEARPRLVTIFPGAMDAPLSHSYCSDVLDYQFGRARAGTVWFLSELLDDPAWMPSRDLESWLNADCIREIVVMPMAVTRQSVDYIELHFTDALSRTAQAEIEALAPTIERSWNGRKPGLVARAATEGRALLASHAQDTGRVRWQASILGMFNPAGLSRAEFRVCLLLSRGLSVRAVSEELGLSENTVRSHLRSIYAKTETSGLSELIYLILSIPDEEAGQTVAARRA